jgi:hypothetical protein
MTPPYDVTHAYIMNAKLMDHNILENAMNKIRDALFMGSRPLKVPYSPNSMINIVINDKIHKNINNFFEIINK